MKKPGIPSIPMLDPALYNLLSAIKINIETMNGSRGGQVTPLASTATLAQVITTLNAVIDKLNAS